MKKYLYLFLMLISQAMFSQSKFEGIGVKMGKLFKLFDSKTTSISFEKVLKVTIQALGWRGDGRYLPLQAHIAFKGILVSNITSYQISKFTGERFIESKIDKI